MFNDGSKELSRAEVITILSKRDDYCCQFPNCTQVFDNDRHRLTIDHIKSQAIAREAGWTYEEINNIDNLQLMGKSCNARKGQLEYDENGELPIRDNGKRPKPPRPVSCDHCLNGRILLPGEDCELCGRGPQPEAAPTALQLRPKECRARGHRAPYHCWLCWIGIEERQPAIIDVLDLDVDDQG